MIVGCADERELALQLIAAAAKQRSDRPVVALYSGSPNGFLERAFEAGADDLITLPQTAAQLSFALEKALARRRGDAPSRGVGEMVTVLGPKGGTGKTLTSCNVAVALALDGRLDGDRRSRPAVRRRRARARAPSRADDLRPRRLGRVARRRQDRRLPGRPSVGGACAACAVAARPGGCRQRRVPARGLRHPARSLRRRRRRHASGFHARGDRGGRRLLAAAASSGCSTRSR